MFWAGLLGEQAYADKPEANLVRRARVELAGQQQRADDCGCTQKRGGVLLRQTTWCRSSTCHV